MGVTHVPIFGDNRIVWSQKLPPVPPMQRGRKKGRSPLHPWGLAQGVEPSLTTEIWRRLGWRVRRLCVLWEDLAHQDYLKQHHGLPWWSSGWESALQCRGHGFHTWSGTWDPTCVCLCVCMCVCVCGCVWVSQSGPTLCDPMDCSLPGSPLHGILQERVPDWFAISFSRGSFWPRDWTQVSCIACRVFTIWATRDSHMPWDK